jgi:hypothetical protein
MANSTINGLSEVTTLATNDQFVVWAASSNGTRKVKVENLANNLQKTLSALTRKSSNYAAFASDRIAADTTAGAFTITLPLNPAALDWVLISDIAQTWGTNSLTVARNNSRINGLAENLVCDTTGEILLRYEGTTQGWRVFAYGY